MNLNIEIKQYLNGKCINRPYKNQTCIYIFVIVLKIVMDDICRLERLFLAVSHTECVWMRMT